PGGCISATHSQLRLVVHMGEIRLGPIDAWHRPQARPVRFRAGTDARRSRASWISYCALEGDLGWQFTAATLFRIDAPTGEKIPEGVKGILWSDIAFIVWRRDAGSHHYGCLQTISAVLLGRRPVRNLPQTRASV